MVSMKFKLNQMKGMFFDNPKIRNAIDTATRKVLSKFGAYVRTRARSSIRSRKGVSKPGRPPYSHTGLLKKFIFFGLDRAHRSVVIGPISLNTPTNAPQVLEYGGYPIIIKDYRSDVLQKKRRRRKIKPRPYMGPAFVKELSGLPEKWRDSIK